MSEKLSYLREPSVFPGRAVVVTYRCGHIEDQLSCSVEEDVERKRIAAMFDCMSCYFLAAYRRQEEKDQRAEA